MKMKQLKQVIKKLSIFAKKEKNINMIETLIKME